MPKRVSRILCNLEVTLRIENLVRASYVAWNRVHKSSTAEGELRLVVLNRLKEALAKCRLFWRPRRLDIEVYLAVEMQESINLLNSANQSAKWGVKSITGEGQLA